MGCLFKPSDRFRARENSESHETILDMESRNIRRDWHAYMINYQGSNPWSPTTWGTALTVKGTFRKKGLSINKAGRFHADLGFVRCPLTCVHDYGGSNPPWPSLLWATSLTVRQQPCKLPINEAGRFDTDLESPLLSSFSRGWRVSDCLQPPVVMKDHGGDSSTVKHLTVAQMVADSSSVPHPRRIF